jgi:fructose-specific phosphotransferase system IIC component
MMAKMTGVSKVVWVFVIGGGLLIALNTWLMKQVDVSMVDLPRSRAVAPLSGAVTSHARVPVIDPANDLLAPVGKATVSPQEYLKVQPQTSSDKKDYEMPHPGTILLQ